MARLPTYQPRGSVTRGPQSSLSASEIANPYQQIANAFGNFAEIADRKEMDDARIEGQAAVQRDEKGNLTVDLQPNWTEKGRTYNKYAMLDYTAKIELDARSAVGRFQQEARGNPDAFRASWKTFSDQALVNAPNKELRGPMKSILDREGQMGFEGVQDQKYKSDMSMTKTTLLSSIEMKQDEMAALSYQGGTGTDAYKARQQEVKTLFGQLTDNPIFQISQQEADMKMKQMESRNISEALLGQAEREIQTGGVAAAGKLADRLLTDETLALSPQERRQYAGMIGERVRGYKAEVKAQLDPLKEKGKDRKKAWEQGTGLDDPADDDLINNISKLDLAEAQELNRARTVQRKIRDFKRLGDAEQAAILENTVANSNRPAPGRSRPVSVAPQLSDRMEQAMKHYIARGLSPVMAAGIVGNLVQESSLSTSARNKGDGRDGSDSIGLGQWNGPRAQALQSFAASRGASPDDYATQLDFVLHELETTEGASYQRLKAAKNVDEATAAMIGFERPAGWSDANPRGGHGWDNRLAMAMKAGEMQGLTGEELAVSQIASVPPELIKEYRQEVTSDLKNSKTDWASRLQRGDVPDTESLNLLSRQLALVDDQNVRQEYADLFGQSEVFKKAFLSDPVSAESFLSSLEAGAVDGASLAEYQFIDAARNGMKARTEALDKDPRGYGEKAYSDFPSAPPLDLSQPDTWGATFQAAQRGVSYLQARGDVGNVSVLRPAEEAAVAQIFQTGQPQQLAALGNALSSLRPETLKATLSSDGYKAALTGAILSSDPIRHGEAMKQLDLYSEVASWPELEGKFGPDAANRLQDWQARVRYMTPDESTEWLRQRNAPDWQERVKPLVKAGETEARKVEFNDAMEAVAGGWFIDPNEPIDPLIRDEFLRDYVSVTGIRNGSLGDVDAAKKDAATRLRGKWGSTEVLGGTGGRLMLYPPEKYYPDVNGSKTWIREEMNAVAEGFGVSVDNMSLISDAKTEAAVQRGETPGYLISVIDPETGARDLLTDDDGKVIRHEFNPKSALQQATFSAREDRANFNPSRTGRNTPPAPRSPITITADRDAVGRQFGIQGRQDGPTIEGIRQGVGDVLDTMMLKNTPKPARKRGE